MSTRSGKRIHGSFHENIIKNDDEVNKTERKTRSRRMKENDEIIAPKSIRRNNYVSYPVDNEEENSALKIKANMEENVHQALKEQDLNVPAKTADAVDIAKVTRQTRRTKKISENLNDDATTGQVVENINNKKNKKIKKSKQECVVNGNEETMVVSKKSKKKKGKKVKTIKKDDFEITDTENVNMNKSNGSIDSFHSAAGSPIKEIAMEVVKADRSITKSPRRASKRLKPDSCETTEYDVYQQSSKKTKISNSDRNSDVNIKSPASKDTNEYLKAKDSTYDKSDDIVEELNTTFEKGSIKTRRSSIKNSTFDKNETPKKTPKKLNSTFEKNNTPTPKKLNKTIELDSNSRRMSLREAKKSTENEKLNATFDKTKDTELTLNGTFEKPSKTPQSVLNSTFEMTDDIKKSTLNSTYEKAKDARHSINSTFEKPKNSRQSVLNSTFEKTKTVRQSLNSTFEKTRETRQSILNSTFEKSDEPQQMSKDLKEPSLNSTFDKETKLNSTFDKTETKSKSSKTSLISSDNSSNVTLDKSDENSRISITSDDSRTENIVNTTPVLIESSLDDSEILDPKQKSNEEQVNLKPPVTPLKREGTFTKDSPDIAMSPKTQVNRSSAGTPVKRMSLPSPGSTPFPFSKSSQKEKSMMNVTRSIEKSLRRSSLAEPSQRLTKVMFCSPINNPAVVMQQKKKVIKSSLKGSNKSFVFDESALEVRAAPRKRSYTQNDADDVRTKRKRLADPQQQSVDRLSRPRTCSATVKLSEPSTPSKKPITPLKKALTPRGKSESKPPRTKLPNFAALHQKQFDKMESLGECQERKARRARQLLTPTGSATIIERSSPKTKVTTVEPIKVVKEVKKTDTPTKTPKLPTLMSLRPGYTRFGFKMNTDVNPFSVPSKTDVKPREKKPNGALIRQPSQPSLAGTTSRKEVAKQTVMREKSFTSEKRNVTRKENRSVIKGVRTNRRFELQMKMRNVNS